jgi:hypothetical protein
MGKNWRGKKDFNHSGARGKGGNSSASGGVHGITSCRGYAVIVGTCDTVREREANKELVNLLTQGIEDMIEAGELPERCVDERHRRANDASAATAEASAGGDSGGGSFSIEDLLALELAEARGEGGVVGSSGATGASNASVVHSINLDMRGMLLVKILRRDVCPVKLLSFIFKTIRRERQAHSKHLIRLVPGMRCFFPNDVELVANVRGLLRDICVGVALPPIALPVITLNASSDVGAAGAAGSREEEEEEAKEEEEEGEGGDSSCGRKRPRPSAADDDHDADEGACSAAPEQSVAVSADQEGQIANASVDAAPTGIDADGSKGKGSKRRNGDRRGQGQGTDAATLDKATILLLREQRKKLKREKAAAVSAKDRTEGSDVINKVLAVEALYAARAEREREREEENFRLQSANGGNPSAHSLSQNQSQKHALLKPFSYEVTVKLRHHNTLKQGTTRSWAMKNMPAAATANFRKPDVRTERFALLCFG